MAKTKKIEVVEKNEDVSKEVISDLKEPEEIKKAENKEILVYIGPTLPDGLTNGTTFIGGLDKRVEIISKKYSIDCLFVPLGKLALAKQLIRKNGTLENVIFKKTLNKLGGK